DGYPGRIAEGRYWIEHDYVNVTDMTGEVVGSKALQAGQDAAMIARQILKEKSGGYRRIEYPPKGGVGDRRKTPPRECQCRLRRGSRPPFRSDQSGAAKETLACNACSSGEQSSAISIISHCSPTSDTGVCEERRVGR